MIIEHYNIEECTLEEFADKHDLILEIIERPTKITQRGVSRYYAKFKNMDIKDGIFLRSAFGNGDTKPQAIYDLRLLLSKKLVVLNANTDNREEINCPRFIG